MAFEEAPSHRSWRRSARKLGRGEISPEKRGRWMLIEFDFKMEKISPSRELGEDASKSEWKMGKWR
jgi:hypothetical protein